MTNGLDKERYFDAGFSEIAIKPFDIEQMKTAIVRAGLFAPRVRPAK